MPKKTLVKIEEGLTTTSVAYGCAALLDAGLEEQLGPGSPAEEGLDCGGRLAVRIAQRIEILKHNLEAASEALDRIGDELHRWRNKRQRANEELYEQIKALRGIFRGFFKDDEGNTFLGLHGTLPRHPKELHAALGPVARRLADDEWPIPESQMSFLEIDRHEVAESLIDFHKELGDALKAIKTGETREKVAKAAKQRAKKAHDTLVDKSTRFLEAGLELAGLDELAAAVRPDAGRRGRPPKELPAAPATLPGEQKALPASTGGPSVEQLPPAASTEEAGAENAEKGPVSSVEAPSDPD